MTYNHGEYHRLYKRHQRKDEVFRREENVRTAQANRERARYNRVWVSQYKAGIGCQDCGENDPIVLDFDHRDRASKRRDISKMFAYCAETILAEIAKCDVRCANCHRRKTYKETH